MKTPCIRAQGVLSDDKARATTLSSLSPNGMPMGDHSPYSLQRLRLCGQSFGQGNLAPRLPKPPHISFIGLVTAFGSDEATRFIAFSDFWR